MHRYEVIFEYYDRYCKDGKWNTQSNIVIAESAEEAVKRTIKFNGLGVDCEYRIVDVKES